MKSMLNKLLFRKAEEQVAKEISEAMDSTQSTELKSSSVLSGSLIGEDSTESPYEPKPMVKYAGFVTLALAAIFLSVSLMYLPIFFIVPTKMCFLISFGTMFGYISFYLLKGKRYVLSKCMQPQQKKYTLVYLAANIIGVLASIRESSAILCLVLALFQAVCLSYVILVNFSFGKACLDSFYTGIAKGCASLFKAIFRRQ
jgi:hypothetical protein